MSGWAIAVIIIVAIVTIGEIFKARHRAQHGITQDMMGNEHKVEAKESALEREVEELRERVKVLERIATDEPGAKRLSAEIDALRALDKTEERSKP